MIDRQGSVFTCHIPDLLSRRCNFVGRSYATCTVRWVDGVELSRKKGCILRAFLLLGAANGQNGRDARREASWAWNHSWLPPRVLVAGRLQCGAARAGVSRGHGECVELAHLAPRLDD